MTFDDRHAECTGSKTSCSLLTSGLSEDIRPVHSSERSRTGASLDRDASRRNGSDFEHPALKTSFHLWPSGPDIAGRARSGARNQADRQLLRTRREGI